MNSSAVVMIVDDEPSALQAMAKVLSSDRYQIVTATSGSEALDLIKSLLSKSVKLMLLDLSLRDMSGFSLADQAKMLIPDVKILFISGYEVDEENEYADRWVTKPFDVERLRERILRELFGE